MATATQESIELRSIVDDEIKDLSSSPTDAGFSASTPADTAAPANAALAFSEGTYPDGGIAAWSVVAGCSTVFFFFIGIMYSWGVIQDKLQENNVARPSILALIGSMGAGLEVLLAVPSGRICSRWGNQRSAALGSFLVGAGLFFGSWTTNSVPGLFLTVGMTYGLGASLCFISTGPLPAQYFKQKRGIATGITFAFGGLGGFSITLILSNLIRSVGLPWALRTIGLAAWAFCLPACYLLKPRFTGKESGRINLSLFRDSSFVALFASGFLAMFPLFVTPYFVPSYARSIGLSSSVGAWLLAGYNLSSAAGRFLFGLTSDTLLGPINCMLISQILMATSMLAVWTVSSTLAPLIIFVVMNGMAAGGLFSLFTPVVSSIFTSSPVGTTLALLLTGWSVGYLAGGPIAGALVEVSGGTGSVKAFRPAILFAGALATLAALSTGFVRYKQSKKLLAKM